MVLGDLGPSFSHEEVHTHYVQSFLWVRYLKPLWRLMLIPRGSVGLGCQFKVKLACGVFRECYGIAQNSRLSKARGIICPQRSNHLSSLPLPHHTHRTL
jgi:hypothetical protein